jgi:hypothetical protein
VQPLQKTVIFLFDSIHSTLAAIAGYTARYEVTGMGVAT